MAIGLEPSILEQRVESSAVVKSEVQHLAAADEVEFAGRNGTEHLAAREGMVSTLVVVCKSHWEWRQMRVRSREKVTSHSWMTAPMRVWASLGGGGGEGEREQWGWI